MCDINHLANQYFSTTNTAYFNIAGLWQEKDSVFLVKERWLVVTWE